MCPVRAAVPVNAVSMTFPPDPVWVRSAREAVRTAMTTVVPTKHDLIDTAMLLTSEAVTNAVVASHHSLTPAPIGFRAGWTEDGALHVLVQDLAPGEPEPAPGEAEPASAETSPPASGAEQGRGIPLITSEATDWGVCRHGPEEGKSLWFSLG